MHFLALFSFSCLECGVDTGVILQGADHVYHFLYEFLSLGWKMAATDKRLAKKQGIGIN
jgi:hypothetical protein